MMWLSTLCRRGGWSTGVIAGIAGSMPLWLGGCASEPPQAAPVAGPGGPPITLHWTTASYGVEGLSISNNPDYYNDVYVVFRFDAPDHLSLVRFTQSPTGLAPASAEALLVRRKFSDRSTNKITFDLIFEQAPFQTETLPDGTVNRHYNNCVGANLSVLTPCSSELMSHSMLKINTYLDAKRVERLAYTLFTPETVQALYDYEAQIEAAAAEKFRQAQQQKEQEQLARQEQKAAKAQFCAANGLNSVESVVADARATALQLSAKCDARNIHINVGQYALEDCLSGNWSECTPYSESRFACAGPNSAYSQEVAAVRRTRDINPHDTPLLFIHFARKQCED